MGLQRLHFARANYVDVEFQGGSRVAKAGDERESETVQLPALIKTPEYVECSSNEARFACEIPELAGLVLQGYGPQPGPGGFLPLRVTEVADGGRAES